MSQKIVVVKLGGSLLEDRLLRSKAIESLAAHRQDKSLLVLVHGGGKHVDAALSRAGIPKRTAGGLRVTDTSTLAIVVSTLAGTVNKSLVAELNRAGTPAAGIAGCDGSTLIAELHPPIDGVSLGCVGRIVDSDPTLLRAILSAGLVPVVASIAQGPGGSLLNVNADSAAAAVASALRADSLIFLTDVEGFLGADGKLVPWMHRDEATRLIEHQEVSGGMRPKLGAAVSALDSGVGRVVIAGPHNHSLVLAGQEGGTHLVAA